MSIQLINKMDEDLDIFMDYVLKVTNLLNQQFKNFAVIKISKVENKNLLTIKTNSMEVVCEIVVKFVEEEMNVEILHSKLLYLFIKNTTKKECVFNLKKNRVVTENHKLIMHYQFQVVFAYLELMENKKQKQIQK